MKNNSFRYLHLFLVVCSVGLIFSTFSSKETKSISREPTSVPKQHLRRHHNFPAKNQHQPFPQNKPVMIMRSPASTRPYDSYRIEQVVEPRTDINMASGYVLAKNLGAIPLSNWKPSMAPLIHDNGVYGFYEKKDGDTTAIPVAYNQTLGKLTVISTVVHVQGVDEATRQRLISSGYKEYYYFKNIRRLSLQTSPDKVVSVYDSLAKLGLNAKLEVIREKPVAH